MEIKLEGLDKLMTKLSLMGGDSGKALDRAVALTAQQIKRDAKDNCPYDTGRLRGSISSERLDNAVYAVGTNVEYAPYVEYGTGQRGDPRVSHVTTKAGTYPHPFLEPALLKNQNILEKYAKNELLKAIRERTG